MGSGASRVREREREREREPAPPHSPRGSEQPASPPPALPVAQMESVNDLVVVTRGLQQELVDKAAQLRRELHFVTKDKAALAEKLAACEAELKATKEGQERAAAELVEVRRAVVDWQRRAELAAAQTAAAVAEAKAFKQETELARAQAAATEAGGERVFALQREIAALEGDNRGLRQRCTEAEGRLQRFAAEAADISKDAISRAALLEQARQQTTQLMGEERARFAAMEAELTNLRRLVQEADTENALGMRPDEVVGLTVRLTGLSNAAHLNDQKGVCIAHDPPSGRFVVQLRGPDSKTVKVKGSNLSLEDPEPSRFLWQQVRLVGLVNAAHLNGRIGVCSEMAVGGRLVVLLDGDDEMVVRVKPDNLEELSEREREEYDVRRQREERQQQAAAAEQAAAAATERRKAEAAEAARREVEEKLRQQRVKEREEQEARQAEEEKRLDAQRRAREAEAEAARSAAAAERRRIEEEEDDRRREEEAAAAAAEEEERRKQQANTNASAFAALKAEAEAERKKREEAAREARAAAREQQRQEAERRIEEQQAAAEAARRAEEEAAAEAARLRRAAEVEALLQEPCLGVSLGFLHQLLTHCRLEQLTTAQVVQDVILEQTKDKRCSYAQYALGYEGVKTLEFGRATHYVAHAWSSGFADLVAALAHWLSHEWDGDRSTVYFHLDLIVRNQHVSAWANDLEPEQVVDDVLRTTGRALLVLSPLHAPTALRRMWVLYETAAAVRLGCAVSCCVAPGDAQRLDQMLYGDIEPVRAALSAVDGKSALTTVVHDRTRLLVHVKSTLGWAKLNAAVGHAVRHWVIECGRRLLEAEDGGGDSLSLSADAASLLNNLGCLLRHQGRYSDAEPCFVRAIGIREHLLGPNHPDVGLVCSNLAGLLKASGRMGEAAPLIRRYLNIHEQAALQDNRQVAMQLNLLAKSLRMDERYEEARELYERSLAVRERVLGKWHPNVATSLNNLGAMLTGIGQYEDVEPMLKRALAIDKKVYGAEHPRVATDFNNLAVLYNAQGRTGEAEKLCDQAVRIVVNASGLVNDPDVAAILNTLGWILSGDGRHEDAEDQFERALHICASNHFGDDHPVFRRVQGGNLLNVARAKLKAGRAEAARDAAERAVAILLDVRGPAHYETAEARKLLASIETAHGL